MQLQECSLISLDLETNGLSPNNSEILEIGLIEFSKSQILNTFNTYIRPKVIQNLAFSINGITEDMLKKAPTLEEISKDLSSYLLNKPLIIQNAEFDLSFLLKENSIQDGFTNQTPVYCTVQFARKYFPELKSYSLANLRKEFQISDYQKHREGNAHEAIDDCYAAMKVFIECANKGELWKKDYLNIAYHQKNLVTISDYRKKLIST
ncbi:MAG: 3'-5' exonuclease [Leptospiraceae bacterium]|nr:3'-5' exonuclease [Leptospiraceae bacterium]MCK6380890.1 3'-5' exonuclease [Leptospiraceae bacterium]NUM41467.1 3'-5' exonuclease [Leptospiraceae bacterium]